MSALESVISVVSSGNPITSPVADQSYVVTPHVLSVVKLMVTSSPLQASISSSVSIVGVGFTVIVTVNGSPSHWSADNGVTVYIKSCGDVVPATKVNSEPGIVADAAVLAEPPSTLFEDAITQVYVVPTGTTPSVTSSGVIDANVSPSQIVSSKLLICGSGLTVIVNTCS